jgi:integrase
MRALPPNVYAVKYKTKRGFNRTLYYVRFQDWKGIRRNFSAGPDPDEAGELAAKLKKLNRERFDFDAAPAKKEEPPPIPTWSEWAEECLELQRSGVRITKRRRLPAPNTIKREESAVVPLKEFFGKDRLVDLTPERAAQYEPWRATQFIVRHGRRTKIRLAPSTIANELACFRKYLKYAVRRGVMPAAPDMVLPEKGKRNRVLKDGERRDILAIAKDWFRWAVILANETCLSKGDLLRLTEDEIDEIECVIVPAGGRLKTSIKQISPITPAAAAVLTEIRAARRGVRNIARLVLTTKQGKPITAGMVRRELERVVKKASIKNFRFHDIRHTAKTRWAGQGISVEAAMLAAGQASVQSHLDYIHMQKSDIAHAFGLAVAKQWQNEKEAAKTKSASD